MDALETLVREALAEHAHEAPAPNRLVAPSRSAERGPRRWPYALLAAAVVAGVAVGIVIVRGGGTRASGPAAPPTFAPIPPDMNEVSYHGITLQVPDNVPIGPAAVCSPIGVHVYDPHAPLVSCAGRPPEQGLLVELFPYTGRADAARDPRLPHRRLDLPGPQIHVYAQAPTRAEVNAVIASVRVTPIDRRGCTATELRLDNPPSATLLPDNPTTAGRCIYTYVTGRSAFLIESTPIDPTRVRRLAAALRRLPRGAGTPDEGFPHVTRYVFGFADGSQRTIEVRYGHPSTVTDGEHFAHDPHNAIAQAFD